MPFKHFAYAILNTILSSFFLIGQFCPVLLVLPSPIQYFPIIRKSLLWFIVNLHRIGVRQTSKCVSSRLSNFTPRDLSIAPFKVFPDGFLKGFHCYCYDSWEFVCVIIRFDQTKRVGIYFYTRFGESLEVEIKKLQGHKTCGLSINCLLNINSILGRSAKQPSLVT